MSTKASIILALLILSVASSISYAGNWSPNGHITQVYPKPERKGVYFQLENQVNTGCTGDKYVFLHKDDVIFEESYSALLAAFMAAKNVSVYVENCSEHNYPQVKEFIISQ